MNFLSFTPKFWLEVAVMAALAGAVWWGYNHVKGIGYAEAKAEQAIIDKARDEAVLKQVLKGVQDTKDLQAGALQTQGEVNAKLLASTGRINSIVIGLRDRPDRPSGANVPPGPVPGTGFTGATGAGLYRADGQFLIGESAGTFELQTRLKACYKEFDALATKLKGTAK